MHLGKEPVSIFSELSSERLATASSFSWSPLFLWAEQTWFSIIVASYGKYYIPNLPWRLDFLKFIVILQFSSCLILMTD